MKTSLNIYCPSLKRVSESERYSFRPKKVSDIQGFIASFEEKQLFTQAFPFSHPSGFEDLSTTATGAMACLHGGCETREGFCFGTKLGFPEPQVHKNVRAWTKTPSWKLMLSMECWITIYQPGNSYLTRLFHWEESAIFLLVYQILP